MTKYTVNNIPILLKPFLFIYGWIGAFYLCLTNIFFRNLIKIEYIYPEHVNNSKNYIFTVWHENLTLYFISHPKFGRRHIWLSLPFWFMKPVHVMKKIIGIQEIAYGASGIDGKKALKLVIQRLSEGWSTYLSPDGPQGPVRVMKNGALWMSLQTGTPIIPVSFQVAGNWRASRWDRKHYPPFFSTLKVIYGKPLLVTKENFEAIKVLLPEEMNNKNTVEKGTSTLPNV